jgi:hypothetical protein
VRVVRVVHIVRVVRVVRVGHDEPGARPEVARHFRDAGSCSTALSFHRIEIATS